MIAPWIFVVLAAVWFAWLGYKADGRWIRWSVGGALYALVATTMVIGLSDAAFIPVSHEAEASHGLKKMILASLPILVVGGFVMLLLFKRGRLGAGQTTGSPNPS